MPRDEPKAPIIITGTSEPRNERDPAPVQRPPIPRK